MKITPGNIVAEPGEHVVLTGPIRGTVVKADGTEVDVTQDAVVVKDQREADEVAHLIGLRYADEGHPRVPVTKDNPDGFVYETTYSPLNEDGIPTSEPKAVAKFHKQLRSLTAAEAKAGGPIDWAGIAAATSEKKG